MTAAVYKRYIARIQSCKNFHFYITFKLSREHNKIAILNGFHTDSGTNPDTKIAFNIRA